MDWTVDWTMDWAFLIEMNCLTVSWFAASPRFETWAHNTEISRATDEFE